MNATVAAPSLYKSSQRADRANAMIADAGVALQKLAQENTQLHEREVELLDKVSSAERKEQLFRVAVDCANRGVVKLSQVTSLVDRWHSEGRDPSYYADLYTSRVDLSFAASGATDKTSSQAMDKASGARHHGARKAQSDHFNMDELERFVRSRSA